MPGGRGKPKRACGMCKMYKYLGNKPERYTAREAAKRKEMKKQINEG
jgi:hypothetical protein